MLTYSKRKRLPRRAANLTTGVLIGLSLLNAPAWADDEEKVSFSDVPVAVQKAIKAFTGEAPKKVERQLKKKRVVYEGKVEKAGQKQSIEVSEKGEVLQIEKHLAPASLPAPVKKAVASAFPGATIDKAESVHLKGASAPDFFELKLKGSDKGKVRVKPSGEILKGTP